MAGIWVRAGTVTLTSGSKKVTGSGTAWNTGTNKVTKGCAFIYNNIAYEVDYVNTDTELYLVDTYNGATGSGLSYRIQIAVTDTIPELASRIATALAYWNGQANNLESWTTGAAANVTLTGPAGNQVTVPNLAALNSGSGGAVEFDMQSPARYLRWQNFGTGHTVFDASKGLSPNSTAIDNATPQNVWQPTFPTLMGWNGQQTYGVRVDSARHADTSDVTNGWHLENTALIENNRTALQLDYSVGNEVLLLRLCILPLSSTGSREIVNLRGSYGAWTGKKGNFDISVTNRDGFKISGLISSKNFPRFIAYQQADGTTWLYMQMTQFTCVRGVMEWSQFAGITPEIDRSPAQGTLVWDTANGGSQSVPSQWTDDSLPITPGNWSPVITGVSDIATVNATYYRVGNLVTIRLYISFIGKTVPANDGKIYAIPFIPKNSGSGCYIPCSVYKGGVSEPNINAYIHGGENFITLNHATDRTAYQFESGADYMMSTTYEIA